jgi:hypothetical protein
VSVYAAYLSNRPDETTVNDVLKDLQDNNIDVSQLLDWTADHSQQAESTRKGGDSAHRH